MFENLFLVGTAYAQQAGGAPKGPSTWEMLVLPIGFLLIMYFLIIRPQSKKAKDHAALISGLKVGDEVVTSGGIIGRIKSVADTFVSVEIAPNATIKVLKAHVSGLTKKEVKPEKDK